MEHFLFHLHKTTCRSQNTSDFKGLDILHRLFQVLKYHFFVSQPAQGNLSTQQRQGDFEEADAEKDSRRREYKRSTENRWLCSKDEFLCYFRTLLAPAVPLRGVGAGWGGTHLCLMPLPPVTSFPKFICCLTSNLSAIWDQIRPLLGQPRNLITT